MTLNYQIEISNRFEALQEPTDRTNNSDSRENPESLWGKIENTIKTAAKLTTRLNKPTKNKPGFDTECELWFEKRTKVKLISLQNKCAETYRDYIEIRKNISRLYRLEKREWEKNKILDIETHNNQINSRKMYRGIHSVRKGFQSRT